MQNYGPGHLERTAGTCPYDLTINTLWFALGNWHKDSIELVETAACDNLVVIATWRPHGDYIISYLKFSIPI